MSHRQDIETNDEEKILSLSMELMQLLHSGNKIQYENLDRLLNKDHFEPDLTVERSLFDQMVDIFVGKNSQISPRLIYSKLINEVVGIGAFYKGGQSKKGEIEQQALERIRALLGFSATRDIDIPIACLKVDGPPVSIGAVTIQPLTEEDKTGEWWGKVKQEYHNNPEGFVYSYARVSSPGEQNLALNFADHAVKDALLILRGIGFPFVAGGLGQFGLLNEFPVLPTIPYRISKVDETVRLEHSADISIGLGTPQRIFEIHSMFLPEIPEGLLAKINILLQAGQGSGFSEMQRKFLSGLSWIGESTKPDTLPARYIKLAIALELLVGGDSNDENMVSRGLTAALAERSAFLLGTDVISRLTVDKNIRQFYSIRSKIVHGSKGDINGEDFVNFGNLVRKIAFALFQRLSEFNKLEDYQHWITRQRYL